jgi:hypothetical protein
MALGIHVLPMYTIPQSIGGLIHFCCRRNIRTTGLTVITLAIGLTLGQSLINILSLLFSLAKNKISDRRKRSAGGLRQKPYLEHEEPIPKLNLLEN